MAATRSYLDFEKPVAELEAKLEELRAVGSQDGAVSISEEVGRLEAKAGRRSRRSTPPSRPGRRRRWPATRSARISWITAPGSSPNSPRWRATGPSARTRPSSAASAGSRVGRSASSGRRRAPPPKPACATISGWPARGLPEGGAPDGNRRPVRPAGHRLRGHGRRLSRHRGEERGQAEAIARSTEACLGLSVPNVALVIGEGGSGGAIALATANRVLMLEHAIYGVISPEGAASILWRDGGRAHEAATAMKITAQDLLRLGVIDAIVPEAVGGAHRDREGAVQAAGQAIAESLAIGRAARRARPSRPATGPPRHPGAGGVQHDLAGLQLPDGACPQDPGPACVVRPVRLDLHHARHGPPPPLPGTARPRMRVQPPRPGCRFRRLRLPHRGCPPDAHRPRHAGYPKPALDDDPSPHPPAGGGGDRRAARPAGQREPPDLRSARARPRAGGSGRCPRPLPELALADDSHAHGAGGPAPRRPADDAALVAILRGRPDAFPNG
ncbi:hypothetical protein Lal_00041160 [Lupinus albus]|nr:hypothetical protein Lal_00041160 [Lupinus albus]